MVAICTCGNVSGGVMYLLFGWWGGRKFVCRSEL